MLLARHDLLDHILEHGTFAIRKSSLAFKICGSCELWFTAILLQYCENTRSWQRPEYNVASRPDAAWSSPIKYLWYRI